MTWVKACFRLSPITFGASQNAPSPNVHANTSVEEPVSLNA